MWWLGSWKGEEQKEGRSGTTTLYLLADPTVSSGSGRYLCAGRCQQGVIFY